MRTSVAVIGSGISGLTAAYLLRRDHDVTVFEADTRFGGHSHTHAIDDPDGTHHVDTGFIVHNDRTYPLLRRLFSELGVEVRPTEMSMSIACDGCGLEFAGGRGGRGVFAQGRRLADPRFLKLLVGVKRFQRHALALLDSPESPEDPQTYGEFLHRHRFSDHFIAHYAVPVVSCVWSMGHDHALGYPARYLFEFLRHHGFLSVSGSPQWYTVVGGSHTYVDRLTHAIGDVRSGTAIRDITRKPDAIELIDARGALHTADKIVVATHADDALALLTDASDDERELLGAFGYSRNRTVLHRDAGLLPRATQAQAAWNYRKAGCAVDDGDTTVTYWMNRLQGIDSDRPFLVTLNDSGSVDRDSVEATMDYTHPLYTPASVAAQARLRSLATDRTVFAGAYHGWGFHEDGCRSGVEAAAALGVTW